MKTTILVNVLFIVIFGSCSPIIKETIVDAKSGEIVGGYTNEGHFALINGHRKKDISEIEIKNWREKGIGFMYTHDKNENLYAITIRKTENYTTSKGSKVGDDIKKAQKIYGKPLQDKKINYDIGGHLYYVGSGLFYKGLTIYYDEADGKIISIQVGKNLLY